MSELTDKIRSKGYWDISILPRPYKKDRYRYETLEGAIGRATVRMRGWPVPFIDSYSGLQLGRDWVGQEIDGAATGHFEAWRFFTSGQFNELRAVSADWRTGDMATRYPADFDYESVIEVWEILYYITEVFELAARCAMGGPPADSTTIVVRLNGMKNRGLVVDQPGWAHFMSPFKATIPDFDAERTLTSSELLGEASKAAVAMAREFFLRFNWQPSSDQLTEMQEGLTTARW